MKRRSDKHQFYKAWRSPPEELTFLKSKFVGRVLNVCAGESLIGDVNVDLYPRYVGVVKADVLADDFYLGEKFDTVYSDPPWNWPYDVRHKFNKMVARHLKPGGLFIQNAPWLPAYKFEILECFIPHTKGGFQKNITVLSISRLKR